MYAAYAKHLEAIPSEASERSARFALDPQQLAKLALADADRYARTPAMLLPCLQLCVARCLPYFAAAAVL